MTATHSDAQQGMQLAREGRFAEALPHLDRANRAAPADVALLNAVGNLLVLAGRGEEANERYRIAQRLIPADLRMLCGWARISLMMGQLEQAADLFDRAFAVEPRCVDPGGWMQDILKEIDAAGTACDVVQTLVQRHPEHAGLRAVHAQWLKAAHRPEAARAALEACLALRPHDVWVHIELGGLAAGHGATEQAQAYYRAALRMDPSSADALWGLAELAGWNLDPKMLAAVQRALAAAPPARAQLRLHETLARHHDRAGEFAAAWRHAGRSNALAIETTPPAKRYDAHQYACRIDTLIEHCTPSLLQRLRGAGNDDPRPVFVIGLPRSGTTLIKSALTAHPRIGSVNEQHFAEKSWKRALAASGDSYATLSPAAVTEAAGWHLQRLLHCAAHLGVAADAMRIIDKMPDNFMLAGWLAMAFPRASFIHVQRDPRDVAVSCWFSQFTDSTKWIHDLSHIAHRIEHHRRLLRHWRTVLGERLVEVRYEDLVANHEDEIRRVLAALSMPWHADVLAFAERAGYVATASRMQVREGVHARSLERWRNYADALAPVLDRLDAVATQDRLDLPPRSQSPGTQHATAA